MEHAKIDRCLAEMEQCLGMQAKVRSLDQHAAASQRSLILGQAIPCQVPAEAPPSPWEQLKPSHAPYPPGAIGGAAAPPVVGIDYLGTVTLGPGEAFTRATVLDLLKRIARGAVIHDRERHPVAGWVQRHEAGAQFCAMLADVLADEGAPADAAACICLAMAQRLGNTQ